MRQQSTAGTASSLDRLLICRVRANTEELQGVGIGRLGDACGEDSERHQINRFAAMLYPVAICQAFVRDWISDEMYFGTGMTFLRSCKRPGCNLVD
jgi:hypothetical protein